MGKIQGESERVEEIEKGIHRGQDELEPVKKDKKDLDVVERIIREILKEGYLLEITLQQIKKDNKALKKLQFLKTDEEKKDFVKKYYQGFF